MSRRRAPLAVLATVVVTAATITASTSAQAATTTFTATADTYVDNGSTGTNYGTSGQLGVDNAPVKRTFLKFVVSGLTETVSSVKLRVHTDDVSGAESPSGGTVRAMSDTSWSETGVTWNAQPGVDGATLGSLGSVSRNAWYEVDVTGLVTGNGTFAVAVTSSSSDGADFDSRESGATTAPRLVVTTGTPPATGDPVFVGAGDIADSGTGDSATAALLDTIQGTVWTTGDNVYPDGTLSQFNSYYEPTWGRHKARTRPSPGNHDYNTSGASGYYSYFGSLAGPSGQGYYSYDIGNWHIVSLNSNITMSAGSAQEQWLRQDLAASTKPCTAAYWHHPLFTSGANHAPSTATKPLFQALYDYNADVVLFGHNHQYERFAPQNPSGGLDTARGIRTFVAGMGGAGAYGFGTIKPNSEARNTGTRGVLKLTLHSNSFDWQFVPESGKTYADSGTTNCH
ncbi:DNRLRE domain-containing protein [Nocardia sp. NRRL S-836]|uniref:CBM96 family carbohydrate-binding protein n=1 Tax=Nocardia sp. NRRL S-836 TaxID=1519492 RepID=UPI0006AFC2DA|nr:DNRLRE domain-containing protein [Nocardia sp. NRRL S-836]KOV81483.1 alkaline phosphatase [Nocardia sp. NRRL S-836]